MNGEHLAQLMQAMSSLSLKPGTRRTRKKFPNIFLMVKAKGSQKSPAQLQYAALADM